jgi:hypothetical protein
LARQRRPEKSLRRRDVPLGAEQEIDGVCLLVDGSVKLSPAAFDLDVGFVDAPAGAGSACEAVAALFEFRNIAPDPAHDRRMGEKIPRSAIISARSRKLSLSLR